MCICNRSNINNYKYPYDHKVKQAHLSAKESARKRRNAPLSARAFNAIQISTLGRFDSNSVRHKSLCNIANRKARMPISSKLPPNMIEPLDVKAMTARTHRTHGISR